MVVRSRIHKSICIVLINYNNYNDTTDCIRSIINSENTECPFIVIVDNSDEHLLLEENLYFYPDKVILSPGRNLGFAEGNNLGIRWALDELIFDYLFILNNDTLLLQNTLTILFESAERIQDYSIFTPCIITADNPGRIWYAGGIFNFSRMTLKIRAIDELYGKIYLENGKTDFASGCSIFISSKRFEIKGDLFDKSFFMYDEDVEFSIRMNREGRNIYFLSDAVVIHKCQGSQSRNADAITNQLSPLHPNLIFYLENTIKNRYYITNKHFQGLERLRIINLLTFYWMLKICQYILFFKFRASFTGLKEIFKYFFQWGN